MTIEKKGVEVEVNDTKPMGKKEWDEKIQSFNNRREDIEVLKGLEDPPTSLIEKQEKRLEVEENLFFSRYHEKGKKRRAVSSKIESAILGKLEGKDKEQLTEMISEHRSQGIAITNFLRDKNIVTTKTKNGGEEVDAYPTCSTKWDNDNEV
tara:strand:+ start:837 stop:1289 length:453 start_codon:yes stop_codon:yes gene_type:complete